LRGFLDVVMTFSFLFLCWFGEGIEGVCAFGL